MLNGIDPLLVIVLKNRGLIDFFGPGSLLDEAAEAIGIPIPIYLSEKLTGIYVESETRGIDVTTRVDSVTDKNPLTLEVEPPQVSQTSSDSQVSINLVAKRDCILLTAILALMDQIVNRLVSAEYAIHYINGPTVIFGGLLHRFGTSVNRNDNLVRMELVLSTAAKENPTPAAAVSSIPKVTGTVPL